MPDIEYNSDGLRVGARGSRQSADGAEATAARLRGGVVSAGAFGNVGNAGAIAGQTETTKQERVAGAVRAGEHRDGQGERADSAAGQGDDLTAGSTAIANSAPRTSPRG